MNILFLDIDGVLNDHPTNMREGHYIHADKVLCLNRILAAKTPEVIVIVSSWRERIFQGSMTYLGFKQMLSSHNIKCDGVRVSCTRPNITSGFIDRPEQVLDWLLENGPIDGEMLVLDDAAYPYEAAGLPVYRPHSMTGLQLSDIRPAIEAFAHRD